MNETTIETVRAWLAAVNAQDAARVLAQSDPDVEIVGPRGSGRGHALLRDWLARAGAGFETLRLFAGDGVVVVEQRGVWRDPSGTVIGEADVASLLHVRDGRVVRYARYDSLQAALDAAGTTVTPVPP